LGSEITDHGKKLQAIQSEFLQLIDEMIGELDAIWHQIEQNDSQVWRRAYCKSLFSFVEGASYLLKREIILLREGEGWDLDGRDKWVLTESRPARLEDGEENRRPFFLPTLDNLTYALEEFAYWNWADYKIDKKSEGWSNLCKASRIRNRIAHPKSPVDLYISDAELSALHNATENFKDLVADTFHSSGVALLRIGRTFFTGSEEEYWESIRKMAVEIMSDEK
jgi:hypothetical protein